jgi:serine/threonine protein kinase
VSPPEIPQSIGRYEVIGRLGRGGMGMVFRGLDPKIGRQVAIKLLHVDDENQRERFLQEAQSAGRLKHPNIVTIYDFGEHEGKPYIVMEFVEGVTLAEEIHSRPDWPLAEKLDLIESLADGLEYAHLRGIVHRDVKPANLMLDPDGVLKILDFGIARVSNSGLTQVGTLMGTPNYMSPEQIEGRPVDRRSDIFAVGVVIYELFTGTKAFAGDTVAVVMTRILREPPTPLVELCPDLDPALIGIVDRALKKNPERRYQTLADLSADIRGVRKRLAAEDAASLERSTIQMQPPAGVGKQKTSRPGLDRNAISRLRAERIESHLREAQEAFNAGDYGDAVSACEQAALIDPDDLRVMDLLARAGSALRRRQVNDALIDARSHLDQGDVARARELVVYALEIDPSSSEAARFKAEIDTRERNRDAERRRREAAVVALAAARKLLDDGEIEAAIRAASDILISDPGFDDARELTRSAVAALEERRRREQAAQVAANLVEDQRRQFANGRRQEAIAALEAARPKHEIIDAGIGELRAELLALQRKEADDRARQQRERADAEAKRRQREKELASKQDAEVLRRPPPPPSPVAVPDTVVVPPPTPPPALAPPTEGPLREPDASPRVEWKMAAGALAVALVGMAGGIWWLTQDGDGGRTTTTIAATTIAATTSLPSPTTSTPATTSAGPARPAALLGAIAAAEKLRGTGDLRGAAREVERAVSQWPKDVELRELANRIAGQAADNAERARRSADRVPEAPGRQEYLQGVKLLTAGGRSRAEQRFGRATDQYLDAEQSFIASMRATQQTKLTTTSIPVVLPTTIPTSSSTSTSTVQSTVATTSVVPLMSVAEATQLLNRYAAAYAKWDIKGLRAMYPQMPRNDELVLEAERRSYSSCVHAFSAVRVSGTLAETRIDADAIKTCTPNTRQPPQSENQHHIFDLQRQPNGAYVIVRHAR